MGCGIATCLAVHGVAVQLIARDPTKIALLSEQLNKRVACQVRSQCTHGDTHDSVIQRIQINTGYDQLGLVDGVIEAIAENQTAKQQLLATIEAYIPSTAFIATTTSALSIATLGSVLQQPQRFCGVHFMNPAESIPLVEIIAGQATSQAMLNRIRRWLHTLGKTSTVVKDSPGFLISRIVAVLLAAFDRLLVDGIDFQYIDQLMQRLGWSMGCARLADTIGMDTVHNAIETTRMASIRLKKSRTEVIQRLVSNHRLGEKTRNGFYHYRTNQRGRLRKQVDPSVYPMLYMAQQVTSLSVSDKDIINRITLPLYFEAIDCLDEGVVMSIEELDQALLSGMTIPKVWGSLSQHLQHIGWHNIVLQAKQYQHLGPLYQPGPGFISRAKKEINNNTAHINQPS